MANGGPGGGGPGVLSPNFGFFTSPSLGVIFPRLVTALLGFTSIVVVWAILFGWVISGWKPVTVSDFSLFGLQLALLIFFTWLVPRLLFLLVSFIRRSLRGPRYSNDDRDIPDLLPFQKKVIEKLKEALGNERYNTEPITISLQGTWGSGKTVCINQLRKDLEDQDKKIAVVYINAWQHEADPLPELALYREIAGKWEIIRRWGWLAVPAVRLLFTYTPLLLKLTWSFGKAQAQVDGIIAKNTPPSVVWQTHLKTLVKASGKRVVVVLDDIDRCSPVVAQCYVTLVRRFLFLPNVAIIIPYVEEQLRYKVFNPLIAVLPDIAGTIEAALQEAFGWSFHAAAPVTTQRGTTKTAVLGTLPTSVFSSSVDGVLQQLRDHLINKFFKAPPQLRQRILTLCAEKYLSDRVVMIGELTKEDFPEILMRNWGVQQWLERVQKWLNEKHGEALDLSTSEGITKWLDAENTVFSDSTITRREIIEKIWEKATRELPLSLSIRQLRAVLGLFFDSPHDDGTKEKKDTNSENNSENNNSNNKEKYLFNSFLARIYLIIQFSQWRIDVGTKENLAGSKPGNGYPGTSDPAYRQRKLLEEAWAAASSVTNFNEKPNYDDMRSFFTKILERMTLYDLDMKR